MSPSRDMAETGTFAERVSAARSRYGPLVVGLDPSGELLEAWGLGDRPAGLERFVDIVVAAFGGVVGFVKPQSAFYERHGWEGIPGLVPPDWRVPVGGADGHR